VKAALLSPLEAAASRDALSSRGLFFLIGSVAPLGSSPRPMAGENLASPKSYSVRLPELSQFRRHPVKVPHTGKVDQVTWSSVTAFDMHTHYRRCHDQDDRGGNLEQNNLPDRFRSIETIEADVHLVQP
jgi:hypothetical protein